MYVAAVGSEELLLWCEVLTVRGDDALRVEHHDVLYLCSQSHIELGAANGSCSSTIDHNLDVGDVLASHLKSVLQTGSRNDGCAVLVVVHDGDVEVLLQALLDVETLGSLDVLKVDAAERGRNLLHSLAELLGVFLGHLDVEHVDAAVDLEQQTLAFHYWLAAHCADVAQSQHGCAVRDDSYQVAFVCVLVNRVGIFLNLQTRIGHARRIGQAEVGLCVVGFCRFYFNFSGTPVVMILQGGLFCNFDHSVLLL